MPLLSGPPVRLTSGTLTRAEITTRRQRPLDRLVTQAGILQRGQDLLPAGAGGKGGSGGKKLRIQLISV